MATTSDNLQFVPVRPVTAEAAVQLVRWVVCPHCWHTFRPEDVLWIAEHEDLMGDPVVAEAPLRFLPTRFNLDGLAIDARGMVCHAMACPRCHLSIPRVLLENEVTFFSLIGSVGSGKSNLLAAMTWQLRQQLPREFGVIFSDGDKESNWIVNHYEESLFLPDDPERPTLLEKTRTQGEAYQSVLLEGVQTQLPKPFLFAVHPSNRRAGTEQRRRGGTILCLYDNAGEHFAVGQDSAITPVTRHLAHANVLMFLFDPTQDTRFRERVKGLSDDPQVTEAMQTLRQETILSEATLRVRKHRGLSPYQRYDRPLLVLVAKSDIWGKLLPTVDIVSEPVLMPGQGRTGPAALDMPRLKRTSRKLRDLLLAISPEIVTAAEDFASDVTYLPVSALGHSPQRRTDQPGLVIKPKDVHPHWTTVPLLYAFARWYSGLVPMDSVSTVSR